MSTQEDRVRFIGFENSTFNADAYCEALSSKNCKAEGLSTEGLIDEMRAMNNESEVQAFGDLMKTSPLIVTKQS
uniref:Uncharacterized protein n=1 Tax=Magnetococcus massalia (strain MO-1) TaxID=451514 RepID=A0A1S7LI46_MAGMO|nr:Protein of unknown function [Candidatus Magnetococcus massalia]